MITHFWAGGRKKGSLILPTPVVKAMLLIGDLLNSHLEYGALHGIKNPNEKRVALVNL